MRKLATTLFALTALWSIAHATPTVEVVEETDTYRLVRHDGGETEAPTNPQRIVSLFDGVTDTMLALGKMPVGVATVYPEFLTYFANDLEQAGVVNVGSRDEPNLEAILAAQPDLILTSDWYPESYAQLSRIAPTVFIGVDAADAAGVPRFRRAMEDVSKVLGLEEAAAARMAAYEAKVAEAKDALSEVQGKPVSVIRMHPNGILVVPVDLVPVVFDDLALTPDPFSLSRNRDNLFVSLEVLPQIRAEHIFLITENAEVYNNLTSSPLWQNLAAVQAGRVYEMSIDHWTFGYGVIAAELIIDDVLASLTDQRD